MPLRKFEGLLKESMGLDAASIGASAIARAVRERMSASKEHDLDAYWAHVSASVSELQKLIEQVVVPETWFFRDRGAFTALARLVLEGWLPTSAPNDVLRVLSLPSSTGEEPYSIAMALLDACVPPKRFHVDAVDISARALEYARVGLYGKNSFRGDDQTFRDRHFEADASGFRVRGEVRQLVRFQQGNLLAPDFLPGEAIYDVVFCRNLLIYFDRTCQDRAVAVLERLLTAKGVLFVAPSETGLLLSHRFESLPRPRAFAFHRPCAKRQPSVPRQSPKREPALPRTTHKSEARLPHRRSEGEGGPRTGAKNEAGSRRARTAQCETDPTRRRPGHEPSLPRCSPEGESGLMEAMRLANEGRFAEATACCEKALKHRGPSVEVFHLLGIVSDAIGQHVEAAAYYRKALYLEPHHPDVLAHMTLLLERLDKKAEAEVLRARQRRLAARSSA